MLRPRGRPRVQRLPLAALLGALCLGPVAGAPERGRAEARGAGEAGRVFTSTLLEGRVSIRPVEPGGISRELCGIYVRSREVHAGMRLSIFPDGHYSVSHKCDICPERVLEIGRWELRGDSVALTPSTSSGGASAGLRLLEEAIGKAGSLRLFFRANRWGIDEYFLLAESRLVRPTDDEVPSLARRVPFYDWEASLSRHREQLEARTPAP